MKRDLDLIKKILEETEKLNAPLQKDLEIDGHDLQEIAYHMVLLQEAGLMKANTAQSMSGKYASAWPIRLTWDGHEFLELARNQSVWEKSKNIMKEKTGTVSVAILIEILKTVAKEMVGLK